MVAKEATLQVRMDAELKEKVEQLYRGMGTSFAEAVRIFASQSLVEKGMAFRYLNENEIKWLRGHLNDQRPEVQREAAEIRRA